MSKSSNFLHIGGRFGRGEGGLKLFGQCPSIGPTHFKKGLSLACYKISHFQCFGRIQSFFLGGTSPILRTFRARPVKKTPSRLTQCQFANFIDYLKYFENVVLSRNVLLSSLMFLFMCNSRPDALLIWIISQIRAQDLKIICTGFQYRGQAEMLRLSKG